MFLSSFVAGVAILTLSFVDMAVSDVTVGVSTSPLKTKNQIIENIQTLDNKFA